MPQLDRDEIGQKQKQLDSLIEKMAEFEFMSESDMKFCVLQLKEIYLTENGGRNEFRHMYSNVSRIMMMQNTAVARGNPYYSDRAQIIADNFDMVFRGVLRDGNEALIGVVSKLFDHVNLELVRINYNADANQRQDHRLSTTRRQLLDQESEFEKKLNEQVERASTILGDRIEKAEEKTRNLQTKMQRDYIAILGVFAAVVLAFNSGIGFSSSAITAAGLQPSFANLAFIVLLVGFVLANSMAILLGFVWKLVRTGDGSKIPRAALWLLIVLDILMLLGLVALGIVCLPELVAFLNQ